MGYIVIISYMVILYWTVIIEERNLDIFNISGDQNRDHSKHVAVQGIYFFGAYFLIFIFMYVYTIINTVTGAQHEWLWILLGFSNPSQGIYNLVVYMILRYLRFKQEHYVHKASSTLITSLFS